MVDRIILNKQEERFFFEYLRIAGGRTPEECAEAIASPLGRTPEEVLRFYSQTVDTIFKGQKGSLEGFTQQRTHRILTKFYDTKVVPLYGGAGGSLEAGGSERKVASRKRKDFGSLQDGGRDANDRNMVQRKEVVEEAELSSGGLPGRVDGVDGMDGNRDCAGIAGNSAKCAQQAVPKEVSVSQKHSAPGHHASKGVGMGSTPCMHGGSMHTAHTPSQGVGRSGGVGRSVPNEVEIMFVPHLEELATQLAAAGFDPCPRVRVETSETVVSVMMRLSQGWKVVLEGREGRLRLRAPDDCPAVFRGCAWGDPARDGELTLMDVLEALGAGSSTTMGYSLEACALAACQETEGGSVKVPRLTVTERLTAKKGERPSKTIGGKKQKPRKRVKKQDNSSVASRKKSAGGQGTEHFPGDRDHDRRRGGKAGSSAEKENTANKSISFEQQGVASIGSPANDSALVKEGGLQGPREAQPLRDATGPFAGYRVPVGIKNLIKQEPRMKKRQRGGQKPDQDFGVPAQGSEEHQVRKALERLVDSLRQQQDNNLHGGPWDPFSFGTERKEVLKSSHGDSVLEALRLEASNLQGPPPSLPSITPPSKRQKKKGNLSNKNGVIDDPRDLAGLSPPSTFKLPEEFTRIATGGINAASIRSLTDIFATCHPPSPKTDGGLGASGGSGGQTAPVSGRATPNDGALLNLSKSGELPPGFNLKTCDMSMFSLLDGVSNSNWIMKLGDTGVNAEHESVENVGTRPFATLFGDQQ